MLYVTIMHLSFVVLCDFCLLVGHGLVALVDRLDCLDGYV